MLLLKKVTFPLSALIILSAGLFADEAKADIVHLDDVIIDFSLCVGTDCVNGESFGFDTVRLKENNLRLHFDDTSNSSSFPNNDWRIIANDSTNGGANYLAIEDATRGIIPFRVEAGAPVNALYIEADGDIGIKTANPVVDLHIVEGNTPTIRLEQDGSDGFTPQVYDVASNEANFFIRDVTNGSKLFFRAKPNAPSDSIFIDSNGDIGMGTDNPEAPLHVKRSSTAGNLTMMKVENSNGRARFQLTSGGSAAQTGDWEISGGSTFVLLDRSDDEAVLVIDQSGNMQLSGALNQMSDRNSKTNIVPINTDDILTKVASLPVSSWTYQSDVEAGIRHIGPMAQDFYAIFGAGAGETGISSIDTSGVALAAIQALERENNELKTRIEALERSLASE